MERRVRVFVQSRASVPGVVAEAEGGAATPSVDERRIAEQYVRRPRWGRATLVASDTFVPADATKAILPCHPQVERPSQLLEAEGRERRRGLRNKARRCNA